MVSEAGAVIIAGNFAIGTNDNNSVDPGEFAIVGTDATDTAILGAANLDGGKWNHVLLGSSSGPPTTFTGNTQGGNSITLLDTAGNNAGTMTSSGSLYSNWSNATDGANLGLFGEAGLMQSYLLVGATESVTVTLPSSFPNITVYAFFEIGNAGSGGNYARIYGLNVNGSTSFWTNDSASTDSDADNDGYMEWKQAAGTTQATATANANYAAFTGLSGSTVTFRGLTTNRSVLSGFQIVAGTGIIPEPSTFLVWSLLAGLGIGVGWRRKR